MVYKPQKLATIDGGTAQGTYAKGDLLAGIAGNTLGKLAVGTDGYAVVADSTQVTGLNYASPASFGALIQNVYSQTNAVTSTSSVMNITTTPLNTQGVQILAATITPKNAANTLDITISVIISNSGSNSSVVALFNNSGTCIAANNSNNSSLVGNIKFRTQVSAASTTSQTFTVRVGSSNATVVRVNANNGGTQLFGGAVVSSITINEIT